MINVEKSSLFFLFQFSYNFFLFPLNKGHDVCMYICMAAGLSCVFVLCCLWEIENYGFSFGN